MAFSTNRRQSSRIMLLCTAFLFLMCVGECRRCYWCGPLADQVHRSRRAPPCLSHGNQMAACEPGRDHCAVVATAPPHVESRFCVKIYQDECYPLFCNTTRNWKMVCPCRGDLCNGANGDREKEAFTYLAKLARTHNYRLSKRDTTDQEQYSYDQTTSYNTSTESMNDTTENADIEPQTTSIDNRDTVESQIVTETKQSELSTESYMAAPASLAVESTTPPATDVSDSDINNVINAEQSDEPMKQENASTDLPSPVNARDSASTALENSENTVNNPTVAETNVKSDGDGTSSMSPSLTSNTDSAEEITKNSEIMKESTMEMADEPRTTDKTTAMKETNLPTAEARQEETMNPHDTTQLTTVAHTTISANKTETANAGTVTPKVHSTKSPSKNGATSVLSDISLLIITSVSFISMFL